MEDPLPMARVVLEKHKGDVDASLAFTARQIAAARSAVLRRFWQDVRAILEQADSKKRNNPEENRAAIMVK